MKFINNNLGKVVILFFVSMITLAQLSKTAGYCSAQMRFISDEEYIEMTLKYSYEHSIKLTSADASVRAYIQNHPACCKIETTSILDFLDRSARKVYLNYPVRTEFARVYGEFYEEYLSVSSCGKQFSESTGIGSHSPFANNY